MGIVNKLSCILIITEKNRTGILKGNNMSVSTIMVDLRVWSKTGSDISKKDFYSQVIVDPSDTIKKEKGDGCPRIQLFSIVISDFQDNEEPTEAFVEACNKQLIQAAKFLKKQPEKLFNTFREQGYKTDVFIGAWINSDQLDLNLPPEFLYECGRHGLSIKIITND